MIQRRPKIVLTRRWPSAVEDVLQEMGEVTRNLADEPMSASALQSALEEADILCPTVTDHLDHQLFATPKLATKLIANFGVGFNHIDLDAASAAGIQVTNTPGVLTDATAEIALTLLLMSARRAGEGEREVRRGAWSGWRPTHMLSTQVTGKTLGIVGMGRIGQALARKAHFGLDMRILYFSPREIDAAASSQVPAQRVELDELLQKADFVSLHCPATAQTRHLINAQRLSLMPRHAHLINTARGDVIDEAALVQALESGTIAGAGLDVYEQEPRLARGLAELEQVVVLPHMGSGTVETRYAMGMRAVENIRAFLDQQPLPDLVQPRN